METPNTQDGARVVVRAESFGGLSTIPATPSAFHARGVQPQPITNYGRFAVLSEDTDDDETPSVGPHRSDVSFGHSDSDEGGVSDAGGEEEVVETPVEVLPEGPEPSRATTIQRKRCTIPRWRQCPQPIGSPVD